MNTSAHFDILYFPRPARLSAGLSSRLRSADIEPQVVEAVLARYGLEPSGSPRNMPNARRNRNLVVSTRMGRKVLKHYRTDWSAETIAYEHSILKYLAGTDFAAPRLLAAANSETCIRYEGRNYCLFDFVEGLNYSWSFLFRPHRMKLMRTAGRTLASLHRQLLAFTPTGQHHLGFVSRQGGRLRDLDWHAQKVSELRERTRELNDPHAGWLVAHAWRILDDLTDLTWRLHDAPLPRTIIHGDFGLHNILFQGADHATPMDFELARLEWRLSDLVSCLSKLRNRAGEHDMESLTQLLGAYQREYPIRAEEWQWFPQVWKYYKLAKAVQYWSSYFETNGPAHKLYLAHDAVNQSTWLGEHPLTAPGLEPWPRWDA